MTLRENLSLWPVSEQVFLIGQVRGSHLELLWIDRTGLNTHLKEISKGVSNQSPREQVTQKYLAQLIGHNPTTGLSFKNMWLIDMGTRNQENIINDNKSQISILGKLSTSDVIFFSS